MSNNDSRFLKACFQEEVDRTPVWFMRQAGRYLSEYRRLRERYTLLDICMDPELAKEVTLQPLRRFNLDAAIVFADILLPLKSLGISLDFVKGKGPVIQNPIRAPQMVYELRLGNPEQDLSFVYETLRLVRNELDPKVALIGFAGAPFTVSSYIIEGGSSRNYIHTKRLMLNHPEAWHRLMRNVTEVTQKYVRAQVEAGAQAIQIFDSWVGCLNAKDYREYVQPYSKQIFNSLEDYTIPTIHFGTGTTSLLELMKEAGGTVIGVDWRINLGDVWQRLGDQISVQGNLDPVALLSGTEPLRKKVDQVLEQANNRPGHIFNLGHGILPQTPVENVEAVVRWVHAKTRK